MAERGAAPQRKAVQMVASPQAPVIYTLCNDGSVWVTEATLNNYGDLWERQWRRLSDIPQERLDR